MRVTASTERLQDIGRAPILAGVAATILAVGSMMLASRAPMLVVGACMGLVFVVIVLANLTIGVCAFVLLQFFATLPGANGQDLTVIKLAGGVLVMGWVAALTSREERLKAQTFIGSYPIIFAALATFVMWGFVGLLWAPADNLVMDDIQRYTLNFLLVAIIYTAVRSAGDLALVSGSLAIGGALSAVFGLLFVPPSVDGRLGGTVGQSNDFAASLVPAAILAVALAWTARSRLVQLVFAGAAVMCIAGIVLSLSRLGFIALPVAFIAWAIYGGRWRPRIIGMLCIAAAVAAAVFLLAAPSEHRERVFQGGDGSGRTDLWTVALRVWESHPFRGVGFGNFVYVARDYVLEPGILPRADLIIDDPHHAHNMYLGVMAEGGLVALALLAIVAVGALVASIRAARIFERTGDKRSELLARSVFAAQIGIMVAGLFIYTQFEKPLWITIGLGLGAYGLARLSISGRFPAPVDDRTRPTPRRIGRRMPPRPGGGLRA